MVASLAPRYVAAPPTTPRPYGLFSAAVVVDETDGRLLMGTEWEPDACGADSVEGAAFCDPDAADLQSDDATVPLVNDHPFSVLNLFECRPIGGVNVEERAKARLVAGEQRAVERVLMDRLARDPASTLLASSAQHPVDALAQAEQYAASAYGAVATLLIPVQVVTVLSAFGVFERNAGSLTTLQGTRVASVATTGLLPDGSDGGTDPDVPAAGTAALWVAGTVVVRRSAVIEAVPQLPARITSGFSNDFRALAMRPYSVGWECIAAAVPVETTYSVPA